MLVHDLFNDFFRKDVRVDLMFGIWSEFLQKLREVLNCDSVQDIIDLDGNFFKVSQVQIFFQEFIALGTIHNFMSHLLTFQTNVFA